MPGTFAANIEHVAADAVLEARNPPKAQLTLQEISKQINSSISYHIDIPLEKTVTTIIVMACEQHCGSQIIALLVRGDHTLNEVKANQLPEVLQPLSFATEALITQHLKTTKDFLGPVHLSIPCIVDKTVARMSDFCAGANQKNTYYTESIGSAMHIICAKRI